MDPDPLIWQLLLQLVLILINAFFACAEIAVISINDNKIAQLAAAGNVRALRLQKLTDKPAKFLATIQVGITLAGFLGSAFAAGNFADRLAGWFKTSGSALQLSTLRTIMIIVITVLLSYFTLVLGELVPKRIAMQKAESIGLAMSGAILFVSRAAAPLVFLLTASTNGILRLLGIDPNAEPEHVTEEEIRMMVDVGSEKGAIDAEEKVLIHNIFEFDNKTADEVMTHRVDVTLLWLEEDDDTWNETIIENRHSHYPVCDDTSDNIVGVLVAKDYFRLRDRSRGSVMQNAVYPAQFVPESVKTDVLFRNMKTKRNHFAVILDEYGGMSGIVTINDLLEQLVGDLEDDASAPPELPFIEKLEENIWQISCAAPLDDVMKELGVALPEDVEEEFDTFAGLVLSVLGTIPDDGQTPEVDAFGMKIRVTQVSEHRIDTALVSLLSQIPEAVSPEADDNSAQEKTS